MNAGSLFSGIGGLDLGLARAGFRHLAFCESDPYRRDVLRARWPGVPVWDDVRDVGAELAGTRGGGAAGTGHVGEPASSGGREQPVVSVDLLCGGFPCQDLSVAGQRRGLMHQGGRSNLFFEFARIAESLRPRWVLVENVPGLLSSNGGRDFGTVLGTLADIGYGVAWRVLDSRYFGVPQRRRRVFIVGAVADGDPRAAAERAGEVLAVGSRCPGHPPQGTEAGQDIAGTLGGGAGERGWAQDTERMTFVASLTGRQGRNGDGSEETFIAAPLSHGSNPNSNMAGRRREDDENLVASGFYATGGTHGLHGERDTSPPVKVGTGLGVGSVNAVQAGASVRRLTPTECERLQGLPDGWTDLGGTADSKRYAALGDAVTVNVAEWIGRRLARSDSNWSTRHDE